jgi:hypothetical protein
MSPLELEIIRRKIAVIIENLKAPVTVRVNNVHNYQSEDNRAFKNKGDL